MVWLRLPRMVTIRVHPWLYLFRDSLSLRGPKEALEIMVYMQRLQRHTQYRPPRLSSAYHGARKTKDPCFPYLSRYLQQTLPTTLP